MKNKKGDKTMKVEFICTSETCAKKGQKTHQVVLPAEMVMDDRNIAAIFCPKCKRKLERSK